VSGPNCPGTPEVAVGLSNPVFGWEAKKRRLDGLYVDFKGTSLGPNPYSIGVDTGVVKGQQNLKFYTTVDWDHCVRGEVNGGLSTIMKKQLAEVRGY